LGGLDLILTTENVYRVFREHARQNQVASHYHIIKKYHFSWEGIFFLNKLQARKCWGGGVPLSNTSGLAFALSAFALEPSGICEPFLVSFQLYCN